MRRNSNKRTNISSPRRSCGYSLPCSSFGHCGRIEGSRSLERSTSCSFRTWKGIKQWHRIERVSNSDIDVILTILFLPQIFLAFFGGIFVGLIFGLLSVLLTRWSSHIRVTEPLVVLITAYLSYMMAEIFWFSGIVSLVTCGLMQQAYVRYNLSQKSNTTIKNVVKILALISEIIIFFFLGRACIIQQHVWDTGFVTFAFVFVIISRFISKLKNIKHLAKNWKI